MKKSIFNNKIFSFIMVFALVFALIIPSTAYADNYKKGQNVVIDKTIRFNSRATGTVVVTMLAENMTIYGEQIYYEFENANSVKAPINFTPQYGGTYTAEFTVTASDSNGNPVSYSGADDVKVFVANEWYQGGNNNSGNNDSAGQDVEVLDPTQRDDGQTTTERVEETESIPFETEYRDDPDMTVGEERTVTEGRNGVRTTTFEVTYINGEEDSRIQIGQPQVTREPVTRVIARGTAPEEVATQLAGLTVEGATLDPEFDPETYEYTLTLDEDVENLVFTPELENELATVEGDGEVSVADSSSHQIVVRNDQGESSTYTFNWETPIGEYFINFNGVNYKPAEGVNMGLSELTQTTVNIGDQEITAYTDNNGNMITALENEEGNRSWYKIDAEGNILKETPSPFSIKGVVYHGLEFTEISDQIVQEFGLERTTIEALRLEGYKINREGFENKNLVRLGRLDGDDMWYEFDSSTNTLTELGFSDVISMAEFQSYVDENQPESILPENSSTTILIIAAVALFMLLIAMIVIKIKKDREDDF